MLYSLLVLTYLNLGTKISHSSRKRQLIQHKELPWKRGCSEVIDALARFVEAAQQEKSSSCALFPSPLDDESEGRAGQVLAMLKNVREKLQASEYRHVADFVRDCKSALYSARQPGSKSEVKRQLRTLLMQELRAALSDVVDDMSKRMQELGENGEAESGGAVADGIELEEWVEEARLLVRAMVRHPACWCLISLPAPWTPQLCRYISTVARPIDLSTIHILLECGHYTSLGHVAADLRLLLENLKHAPGHGADQKVLADYLRLAFLSAPSLADPKDLNKRGQLERRRAKAIATCDAAAAAAATAAEALYGSSGAELKEVENWKDICVKMVRQVSGLPMAWVLVTNLDALTTNPSNSGTSQATPSPSKHAPWFPKVIPGLSVILRRLDKNDILDPLQVLLEVRHVMSRYMAPPNPHRAHDKIDSQTSISEDNKKEVLPSDCEKEGEKGDLMEVEREGDRGDRREGEEGGGEGQSSARDGEGNAEEEDDGEGDEINEYIAEDDETLRNIAKKFGITPEALNAYNRC